MLVAFFLVTVVEGSALGIQLYFITSSEDMFELDQCGVNSNSVNVATESFDIHQLLGCVCNLHTDVHIYLLDILIK